MSAFNKMVFDKDILVESIVNMRIDQYTFPFVLEDNTQNCWHLYYAIQGGLEIAIRDTDGQGMQILRLGAGDLLILSPQWHHSLRVSDNLPVKLFTMALEISGKRTGELGKLTAALTPSNFQALNDIIEYADDIFNITVDTRQYTDTVDKDTTISVKQILQAKIELLLLELLEHCPDTPDGGPAAPLMRSQIISRTNEELRKHIRDSIRIEDICASLNISKSYLSNIYKKKTGRSIIAHFNEMKIEEAKKLIAAGNHNITEVAEYLGFSSIHYFSRLFKSVSGLTPSEYEKSLKEGGARHG